MFPESLGRNSSRSRPEFFEWADGLDSGLLVFCCWFWFSYATKKAVEGSKKYVPSKTRCFLGGQKKLMEHFHAESSKCGSGFLHEISGLIGKSLV